MIMFANTSDFLKQKNIFIMKFRVAHLGMLDDRHAF